MIFSIESTLILHLLFPFRNAIEASINGTASVRGGFGTPSLSATSVDDLGLLKTPANGIGLGRPSVALGESGLSFPGIRSWGNPLSRKLSLTKGRKLGHGHAPSDMTSGGQIRPSTSPSERRKSMDQATSLFSSANTSIRSSRSGFLNKPSLHITTPSTSNIRLDGSLSSASSRRSLDLPPGGAYSSSRNPSPRSSMHGTEGLLERDIHQLIRSLDKASSSDLGLSVSKPSLMGQRRTHSEGSQYAYPQIGEGDESENEEGLGRALSILEISKRKENSTCVDCGRPSEFWFPVLFCFFGNALRDRDPDYIFFLVLRSSVGHDRSSRLQDDGVHVHRM